MKALRIRTRIDSETLHLPELRDMIGKTVEIIVLEEKLAPAGSPRNLDFFLALAPKRQPPTPKEMEELRAAAHNDPGLAAVLEIAEQGGVDVEAIAELRGGEVK